jgi:hypothetical protein
MAVYVPVEEAIATMNSQETSVLEPPSGLVDAPKAAAPNDIDNVKEIQVKRKKGKVLKTDDCAEHILYRW